MQIIDNQTLKEEFFNPAIESIKQSPCTRKCGGISDQDWILGGIDRALNVFVSGRDFLQKLGALNSRVSTYFDTLKSDRRHGLLRDIAKRIETIQSQEHGDFIAPHIPELEGYDIWAGDGHWHKHATHDPKRGPEGKHYATGHLYGLNLRNGVLHHLTATDQTNKLKEHDLSAIKRLTKDQLRIEAPKGRKVIWIWDKAGIDFAFWHHQKNTAGIYFISLEKEKMQLDDMAASQPFDRSSRINEGVKADELCGTSKGTMVRRVTYRDPVRKKTYKFITSLTCAKIEPGVIAQLYRMRWDIEKVFDDIKNKFREQKSWAVGEKAKTAQALFICLTYNLVRQFERKMSERELLRDEKEDERRKGRMELERAQAEKEGGRLPELHEKLIRATQIGVKFIRWIRYHVMMLVPRTRALCELRQVYASF